MQVMNDGLFILSHEGRAAYQCFYLFTPYDLKSYYAFKKKNNCTYFAEPLPYINIYTVHISYNTLIFIFYIFVGFICSCCLFWGN